MVSALIRKPILPKLIIAVASLLLVFPIADARGKKLKQAEVIKLAERFIMLNGYTDLPPNKSRVVLESIEASPNTDELLKKRRNTLERKAYGIAQGRKTGSFGWTVVFRYKDRSDPEMHKIGRAVTMDADGSNMRVKHVAFFLRAIDRRL